MISETTFAKKFTSFWAQLLPNANNYIRLVNGAMVQSLYTPEKPVRGRMSLFAIQLHLKFFD